MNIQRVKGTHDILDISLYNFIIQAIRTHATRYAFQEIATPILEPLELFKRTLGLYTDVVHKEMFVIEPHGTDETDRICLRPEATASVMRAFLEAHIEHTPWRVFAHGSMFRYERPQKGRLREFHQITMEIIGSHTASQDVEMIAMLDRFFRNVLKIDNFALLINTLGSASDREQHKKALITFLEKHVNKICQLCVERMHKNTLRVFDCKTPSCQELYKTAPVITQYLSEKSRAEWEKVQQLLHMLGVTYVHNPKLVRGLDYYNQTVFEFVSAELGTQHTFCAGGRYDQLATMMGADSDYPSIGAAIGIERLLMLVDAVKDQLAIPPLPRLLMIMPMEERFHPLALLLADDLRAQGLAVQIFLEEQSLKHMMRFANKVGARFALILGTEEHASRTVTIKDMITGQQEQVAHVDVARYVSR